MDTWTTPGGLVPYPKTYKEKTPPKGLTRTGFLARTTPLKTRRNTRPYGGASPEFPNKGDFQRFIRERDGVCQLCGLRCGELQVAHLLFKVQAGGRKKVSVNFPWNACLLGGGPLSECHEEQEHDKTLTALLVKGLIARHGYELPPHALERLARYERVSPDLFEGSPTAELDVFDPRLSVMDGRR